MFSPKGKREKHWVMSMELTDDYVKIQKGISVGSTLEDVKQSYSNIEIVPDGRQDSSILTYIIADRIECKYLEFIVTDGIVTTIKLYVENP